LQYLEDRKLLVRTHGGAVASQNPMDEISLYRKLIAEFAAGFVTDNDTLFINTSSNALKILEHISCSNVTVITNNGKAIHCDHSQEVNVVLTGGELRYPKEAMVGDFALRNLQTIYAKKAFIGCSGISAENGMTTELFNEVSINEMMVSHATQEVYVLADHTKIGKNSSFVSCPIDKIKYLITDEKASTEALDLIREKGVTVYVVSRKDR
jgi:DeoR/GlpR family transcriptional regulator of sugar metabolism